MFDGSFTPDTLESQVNMMRAAGTRALLVVEGPTDWHFWAAPGRATCEFFIAYGKNNVLGCIANLDVRSVGGVLGIVDDDYDALKGVRQTSSNVVVTELHDLECVLLRTTALERVFEEYRGEVTINSDDLDLRAELLDRAVLFGRLRLAAALRSFNLDFTSIKVHAFTCMDTWEVDKNGLFAAVTAGMEATAKDDLSEFLQSICSTDPWRIISGRDVLDILWIGLTGVLGSQKVGRKGVGKHQVASFLRSSVPRDELRATKLWSDILEWEGRNRPFSILAPAS